MRLIDADNAIHALGVFSDMEHGNKHFLNGINSAKEIINEGVTIDTVPVVRGKWIPNQHWEYRNGNTTMSGDTGLGCSACGAVNFTGINQRTPFCPECGAKMDGEKEDV